MQRRLASAAGLALAALLLGAGGCGGGHGSRAQDGVPAPDFRAVTLDGERFALSDLRGNVVWLNFFATWCGPCMTEMPRLQRDVWARFGREDFVILAVGREHSAAELRALAERGRYGFPIVPDPEREIYSLYAESTIPRNYIIDAQGRIVHASVGYSDEDFGAMITTVDRLLRGRTP